MKYFINYRTGGLTTTDNEIEAKRLMSVGFTEISEEIYNMLYREAWDIATGNW